MLKYQRIVIFLVAGILVAVVGTGAVFLWRMFQTPPVDVHEVGGTILIYEIDRTEPLDAPTMEQMIEKTKRRFAGRMGYLTVRPNGDRCIEIQVPRLKKLDNATEVETVRSIMAMTGKLDFRIAANNDDRPALEAAQEMYTNPAVKERAKLLALLGSPPEPPRHPTNPKGFLCMPNDSEHANYSWFRMGLEVLQQLRLDGDDADLTDPKSDASKLKEARAKGEPLRLVDNLDAAWLIYSRDCANANLKATERDQIKYEHFLLCRDHVQMKSDEPNKLDGSHLIDAYASVDDRGDPCIYFTLSKVGGDMFFDLTSRNVSAGDRNCYLATIFDSVVLTAPKVYSGIREHGQLSVPRFNRTQVDWMVAVLHAGCLPVPLKPVPVSQTTVEPSSKAR
jgi:preprotein translocase subunit SecD